MQSLKFTYAEENDSDFIRWTSNLLRAFLDDGRLVRAAHGEPPDYTVHSIWRPQNIAPEAQAILITNEAWKLFKPHRPLSDYAAVLGLYPPRETCRFIQYPFAAVYADVPVADLYRLREELLQVPKTRFCCFVISNHVGDLAPVRLDLARRIDQWRRVDSAGKIANNVNYFAPRGLAFLEWIAQYKYMICLENTLEPGYITEKPFQAWFAGTVPIYHGGCTSDLNADAIVNAASDGVLEALQRLEQDPAEYEAKRRAPLTAVPLSLASFETQFRAFLSERA